MTSFALDGAVALVTGAASGIGRATALHLAAAGAAVTVNALTPGTGEEVVDDILAAGGTARLQIADVRVEEEVQRLVADTEQHLGPLRIAVNNAGTAMKPTSLTSTALADWDELIAVNLTGVFLCLRAEITAMRKHGWGSIVNVASTTGLRAGRGLAAYSASKHGVIGLTRAAALEAGRHGIRINAVCPGYVPTPLSARTLGSEQEVMATGAGRSPMGRPSTADDVASVIGWLASDHATQVTGTAVPVDGGVLAG